MQRYAQTDASKKFQPPEFHRKTNGSILDPVVW